MLEIRETSQLPETLRGSAVTIGNFDGVHRGHAEIIRKLQQMAQEFSGPNIVFTFDPHPVRLLRPEQAPPPLTWTRRKSQLLSDLGVDALIAYPTDEDLLSLSPHEFFQRIVVDQLAARGIVEGTNFFFGRDRAGDVSMLKDLCKANQIAVDILEPLQFEGGPVSSSRIRETIREGDVQLAARMLTRPYRLRGMVTHGAQRGSQIGFPTANLEAIDTLVPAEGVYAGRAHVRGSTHTAAINIGANPTFGEHAKKVEVHLLNFNDAIYGEPLEVDFVSRLRDIQHFAGVDELVQQLAHDVDAARRAVNRPS